MIRISLSQAAFDAICATLPLGSVGYENKTNERGERLIWLDPNVVDRLRALCAGRGRITQRLVEAEGADFHRSVKDDLSAPAVR